MLEDPRPLRADHRELDSPPIIVGHSCGGAFAQVLNDRGLGAASVSLDGATVRGVRDLPM